MYFQKGKFNFTINNIGGFSTVYRKFNFNIGLFRPTIFDGYSLFSIKLFNWIKEINILQIFCINILKFTIDISLVLQRK